MRRLVYYIATSLDGFIADPSGDFSSFPNDPATLTALFDRYPETCPAHVRAALGITGAPRRFDAVVMGRRTYQPAVEAGLAQGAYPHLEQYVVSHGPLPGGSGIHHLTGDVASAVAELKARPGKDIWLCGGADLAGQFIDLIDEVQIKVNPVAFGQGISLFRQAAFPRRFHFDGADPLPGGVVLLTYATGVVTTQKQRP